MKEKNTIITASDYQRLDGFNADLTVKQKLTLGAPYYPNNQTMPIAVQLWAENNGQWQIQLEVPLHQLFDLMLLLEQSLLYFKEAYRYPSFYNPEKPTIGQIDLQGQRLPLTVALENPNLDRDIQAFDQTLRCLSEMIGERQRALHAVLSELALY